MLRPYTFRPRRGDGGRDGGRARPGAAGCRGTVGRVSPARKLPTIPYRSITRFEVETAGIFNGDADLRLHLSGNAVPVTREFKRGTDIPGVHRVLAQCVLQ
ncbi:MAG: PH domain-containing protein [Chloroflexaceae bacterium]